MVAIRAIQEEEVVLLAMVPIIKVVTTALLLLLSMLGKNNMVDSRNLLMAQGISPIKANSNNHITKTNMAIMVRHKASRRVITKATMLLTQIPTTLLVAVAEDQTTIMKVNSVSFLWMVGWELRNIQIAHRDRWYVAAGTHWSLGSPCSAGELIPYPGRGG